MERKKKKKQEIVFKLQSNNILKLESIFRTQCLTFLKFKLRILDWNSNDDDDDLEWF